MVVGVNKLFQVVDLKNYGTSQDFARRQDTNSACRDLETQAEPFWKVTRKRCEGRVAYLLGHLSSLKESNLISKYEVIFYVML
jgi:hypothetical protein